MTEQDYKKTNISQEIREQYEGILSDQQIEATVVWWEKKADQIRREIMVWAQDKLISEVQTRGRQRNLNHRLGQDEMINSVGILLDQLPIQPSNHE